MSGTLPKFFKSPHELSHKDKSIPILLGLSGGADSTMLLHLLCKYREITGATIYAAHVNHGIRGEAYGNEALRDQEFCRKLCDDLKVEFFTETVDVPSLCQKSGNSIETEARNARYDFFARIMKEHNIGILATAHNASDNLETQIFNLCRGCGTDGICGIPEARPFDPVVDGVIVRPIISAAKSEILKFCSENKIDYVTDSTNLEDDCTRNRIRHIIIPELQKLFISPERSGLRLAESAAEDCLYLTLEAKRYLELQNGKIDVPSFNELSPSIAKRVIKLAFLQVSSATLEAVHLHDVMTFAKKEKKGSVSLPGGIKAEFNSGILSFSPEITAQKAAFPYKIPLHEGFNVIESTDYAVLLESRQDPTAQAENFADYFPITSAIIKNIDLSSLTASNRREGDKIYDGGVGKKVKKLMCDKKIALDHRDRFPIIKNGEELIYVPFCAVADKVKAYEYDFEYKISIYIKSN